MDMDMKQPKYNYKSVDEKLMGLKALVIMLCVVIIAAGLIGGVCGYKVVRKERRLEQDLSALTEKHKQDVSSLLGTQEYLTEKLNQTTNYYEYQIDYSDETFNYLAIGNSLTFIPSWGRGICSTKRDNDYVNLVAKALKTNNKINPENKNVKFYAYNFSPWERASDRNSADDLLDVYLSEKLDLITIQLSENCISTYKLTEDLEGLVDYVHEKAPDAKILLIGNFWDQNKSNCQKEAAKAKNIPFADLSPIIGDTSYQSKPGTICEGPLNPDGSEGEKIIVSEAAAGHPEDSGMQYIADAVIKALNES